MNHPLTLLGAVSQVPAESLPPSPLRVLVRVVLGVFIALLLVYIAIEQIGSLIRRRTGRD